MLRLRVFFFSAGLFFGFSSCGKIDVKGLDEGDFNGTVAGDKSFKTDILPTFASAGCTATGCHDAGARKGNLLLAGEAAAVQESIWIANVVNLVTTEKSLLLLAPLATDTIVPHGGVKPFADTSNATYLLWRQWIEQGAANN